MTIPVIASPQTRDEIIASMSKMHEDGNAYWNAFDTPAFFQKLGTAWSPAENVRHLIKSTRPVAKALSIPRIFLGFKFGKPKRPSVLFDDLKSTYDERTARGANAGAFAPSSQSQVDLEMWRKDIMRQRADVHATLIKAIRKWPEASLDKYQLPHPLLGNLTIREMLFFTLYHQLHHIEVVERRRRAA